MTNQQLDCDAVRELLPWHWNGTLETREEGEVEAHLESCTACCEDFDRLTEDAEVFAAHLPTAVLVAHVAGEPTPVPASEIEEHLAECSACGEELALVRAGLPGAEGATVESPRRGAHWRRLALAASLVAGVGLIGWLASSSRVREMRAHLDEPEVNVAVVELLPQEMLLRGGRDGVQRIELRPETERVTLALAAPGADAAPTYEIELLDDRGEQIWRLTGLRRQDHGGFTLSVAVSDLLPGGRNLRVYASGGEKLIATYRFDLAVD